MVEFDSQLNLKILFKRYDAICRGCKTADIQKIPLSLPVQYSAVIGTDINDDNGTKANNCYSVMSIFIIKYNGDFYTMENNY